jgi:hypothetical protein
MLVLCAPISPGAPAQSGLQSQKLRQSIQKGMRSCYGIRSRSLPSLVDACKPRSQICLSAVLPSDILLFAGRTRESQKGCMLRASLLTLLCLRIMLSELVSFQSSGTAFLPTNDPLSLTWVEMVTSFSAPPVLLVGSMDTKSRSDTSQKSTWPKKIREIDGESQHGPF